MKLKGTLYLSTPDEKRTCGWFNKLITENQDMFRSYFKVDLFPGSLNVYIPEPPSLHDDLDAGDPPPSFVIPKHKLEGMPSYIGDGQAWPCRICIEKVPVSVPCWIFRRIGSRVRHGIIEIVAEQGLCDGYSLQHEDVVTIVFE